MGVMTAILPPPLLFLHIPVLFQGLDNLSSRHCSNFTFTYMLFTHMQTVCSVGSHVNVSSKVTFLPAFPLTPSRSPIPSKPPSPMHFPVIPPSPHPSPQCSPVHSACKGHLVTLYSPQLHFPVPNDQSWSH